MSKGPSKVTEEAIMIQHIARTTCAMRLLAFGMDLSTRSRCMKRMTKPTVMTARTMANTTTLLARPVTCFMGEMHAMMTTKEEGRSPMIAPIHLIVDPMAPIPIAVALP
jgi:hypothetical protein